MTTPIEIELAELSFAELVPGPGVNRMFLFFHYSQFLDSSSRSTHWDILAVCLRKITGEAIIHGEFRRGRACPDGQRLHWIRITLTLFSSLFFSLLQLYKSCQPNNSHFAGMLSGICPFLVGTNDSRSVWYLIFGWLFNFQEILWRVTEDDEVEVLEKILMYVRSVGTAGSGDASAASAATNLKKWVVMKLKMDGFEASLCKTSWRTASGSGWCLISWTLISRLSTVFTSLILLCLLSVL